MRTYAKIAAAAACWSMLAGSVAIAADIAVISSAGPMPGVMGALIPAFEHASGHKVTIKFQGTPDTIRQINEGASTDVLIATSETFDSLIKEGQIAANGRTPIMLSRVGVAVRAGAPKPDIATVAAFKAALLNAKTVAYSRGTSGLHFETVVERLGLTDALKAKTIRVEGQPVGAVVAKGEAEIGMQQLAELLPVAGIDLVGPLPGDLQKIIVYAAAIPAKAKNPDAAKALVEFLASEAAASVFKKKGMDPAG
ncbi:MAG: molybdate transport system substrate-binding protein [Alphaproteobacteria bacterium]|jgi:molybdate transport system substrate-binding protein|nr:molybdate transport system substrate-binding protein [Alphaproteobacteria bacterium]